MITVTSKIKKTILFGETKYQVHQTVIDSSKQKRKNTRKFIDCEFFDSRVLAEQVIPELDKDLKESIENGIL